MLFGINKQENFNFRGSLMRQTSMQPMWDREIRMLAPVSEGPTPEDFDTERKPNRDRSLGAVWQRTSSHLFGNKRSDLRMLLGVLGAPLAPISVTFQDIFCVPSAKDTDIVSIEQSQSRPHKL
jgi:hypothetical protein